jgi:hypothetical protein
MALDYDVDASRSLTGRGAHRVKLVVDDDRARATSEMPRERVIERQLTFANV